MSNSGGLDHWSGGAQRAGASHLGAERVTTWRTVSLRELILELARVEESLRKLPALLARRDALVPNPARRPLLRRERIILGELAVRRRIRSEKAGQHTQKGAQ